METDRNDNTNNDNNKNDSNNNNSNNGMLVHNTFYRIINNNKNK